MAASKTWVRWAASELYQFLGKEAALKVVTILQGADLDAEANESVRRTLAALRFELEGKADRSPKGGGES